MVLVVKEHLLLATEFTWLLEKSANIN